jgi:3-oxoacyl-[acyl-carrier-protein] synthase-1
MDEEQVVVATGHPCPWVQGFEGLGRLLYLAWWALEDLFSGWTSGPVSPTRIALLVNLPTAEERPLLQNHLLLAADSGLRSVEDLFVRGLAPLLSRGLEKAPLQALHEGHAGVLVGLEHAARLLRTRRADICLVGGVDSYLDDPTLEWLAATGRLKTPLWPTGLMPGEGAAFLAVERRSDAQARGAPPMARLGPLSLAQEDGDYGEVDFRPQGRQLAAVLLDVLRRNSNQAREIQLLLADLNGQEVRATDWGTALVRCSPSFKEFGHMTRWLPASSFGDVGGATAAFQACVAVRAFARGHALGSEILLSSCSEQGLRGALIFKAPW